MEKGAVIICGECKVEFCAIHYKANVKYCSWNCFKKAKSKRDSRAWTQADRDRLKSKESSKKKIGERIKCVECKKYFVRYHGKKIVCSAECKKKRAKKHIGLGVVVVHVKCDECKEWFARKHRGRKYCSQTCRIRANRKQNKRERKLVEVVCVECEKTFLAKTKRCNVCSPSCEKKRDRKLKHRRKKPRRYFAQLLQEQLGYCPLCCEQIKGDGHVDHKVSASYLRARGVKWSVVNSLENLQATHITCNLVKGEKLLPEYEELAARLVASTQKKARPVH